MDRFTYNSAGSYDLAVSPDSAGSYDWAGEEDDRTNLRPKDQAIGLSIDYVQRWQKSHAFRELFQNVKDAMIETNGLDAEKFHLFPSRSDKGVFEAEGRHPDTGVLLGFIHYEEKTGTLELVNFGAELPLSCLTLGHTTKRNQEKLAGGHGEGLKLAALVMLRKGHAVHISASSYYWKFHWGRSDNRQLYCKITAPKEGVLKAQRDAMVLKGSTREKKANICTDVKVTVGVYRGGGEKISPDDIQDWIKTTLDLYPPSPAFIIQSSKGRLILDPNYSNMVYLKGLLLERSRQSGKYKFGYDLNEGTINRDREWMSDPRLVAKYLATIWEEAIEKNEEKTLIEYVNMHREEEAKWADVDHAEKCITQTLAKKIWQFLCTENSEGELFYHDSRNGDSDVEIIRKSLKKEPKQLPSSLWTSLRNYVRVRTPQEQQCHLLKTAPDSQHKETRYSVTFKRSLNAALALSQSTQHLKLVFKSGATVDLDLLLVDDTLLINDKWLDFHESHKNAPCWLSQHSIDIFSCLHIMEHLHDLVLVELSRDSYTRTRRTCTIESSLGRKVRESFHQMPLAVETVSTEAACELKVSWSDPDSILASVLGLDPKCRVTLHRESTCSQKRFGLLEKNDENLSGTVFPHQITADCGCPQRIVSGKDSSVTFNQLDYREEHFPMIARANVGAFFGLPPEALRPSPPTANNPETATGRSIINSSTRLPPSVCSLPEKGGAYMHEAINDNHSLHDSSDSEHEETDASDSEHEGTDTSDSEYQGTDASASEHEETDTTSYQPPASVSSSANNTLLAESPMDTASTHRRSMAPTPVRALADKSSALLSIEDEMLRSKKTVRVQHRQITLLEKLTASQAKEIAELQIENEGLMAENGGLAAENEDLVAESGGLVAKNKDLVAENGGLVAEYKDLVTELQHTQGKLATIREAARSSPEIEGRARAGASAMKRARILEESNDTGSSVRASKRSKESSKMSVETEVSAEEISGIEVMSRDDG